MKLRLKMAGRQAGATHVINPARILQRAAISQGRWNMTSLLPKIASTELCVKWLVQRRLLNNTHSCQTCMQPSTLNVHASGIDGLELTTVEKQ